jgi:hypothetical protein
MIRHDVNSPEFVCSSRTLCRREAGRYPKGNWTSPWISLGANVHESRASRVISLKGKVEEGKITEYRVTLEVTFILE